MQLLDYNKYHSKCHLSQSLISDKIQQRKNITVHAICWGKKKHSEKTKQLVQPDSRHRCWNYQIGNLK